MTTNNYAEWGQVLARTRLGTTPAELHGSVTGFLCAGWGGPPRELLASLALDATSADAAADRELHAFVEQAAARVGARLRAREPVEPLLPDGALAVRADAVVDWCRGFLGGLGLTGVVAERAADPAVSELLQLFGQIAATRLECDGADAAALDDVLDFIREGVARLHAVCAPVVH
jgi:uncharacterized protein YgfB (UPF0149 family)